MVSICISGQDSRVICLAGLVWCLIPNTSFPCTVCLPLLYAYIRSFACTVFIEYRVVCLHTKYLIQYHVCMQVSMFTVCFPCLYCLAYTVCLLMLTKCMQHYLYRLLVCYILNAYCTVLPVQSVSLLSLLCLSRLPSLLNV